jgi:hypothetical protein
MRGIALCNSLSSLSFEARIARQAASLMARAVFVLLADICLFGPLTCIFLRCVSARVFLLMSVCAFSVEFLPLWRPRLSVIN